MSVDGSGSPVVPLNFCTEAGLKLRIGLVSDRP